MDCNITESGLLELRSLNVRFWGLLSLDEDRRSLLLEGLERGELPELKREGAESEEEVDDDDEEEDEKSCEVEEV